MDSRNLEILLMSSGMQDQEQVSGKTCPFCKSTDKSFSMKREGINLFYNCKRDKCKISGMTRLEAGTLPKKQRIKGESKYARWLRTACPLTHDDYEWLKKEWNFEKKHALAGGAEGMFPIRRIVLPIYDATGREVGATLRAKHKDTTPKSIICLTDLDALCLSFYGGKQNKETMLVVEDQASAIRASYYCSSVALLGTSMNVMKARAIAKTSTKKIIFCLDKDAFSSSIDLATKYGAMFDKHATVCPPMDLKNMTEEALADFMANTCNLQLGE